MARVLLAGESWISTATHIKGFDEFASTTFHTGADDFIAAAAKSGIEIEQIYAHDVPGKFPRSVAELSAYDVIILSDIGYNSFVLPNQVWLEGRKTDNPLVSLVEWTEQGGGLMMAGGYLSFQGFQARANFGRSPLVEVLPVTMLDGDDRAEMPQGGQVRVVDPGHPVAAGWSEGAPDLLGYNVVHAKPEAQVVARVADDVLLATMKVGSGRSLVWTSDIGPHWCPTEFLEWEGFAPLVAGMVGWLAGELG